MVCGIYKSWDNGNMIFFYVYPSVYLKGNLNLTAFLSI